MEGIDRSLLNDVQNRFLSLPLSAVEGLEHEPQITDFEFIEELGIGTFGKVDLVSHKITKAKYALKYIDKTEPENLEEKANFNREVEIMYKLNHPNIVRLYGHFEDEKYCYFIMQYIPNRSVYELIANNGKKPNIKLIASVMKDLISAVYYLHNMKPTIIHRDIKPENILLDYNNKAYLTDFGWSNYMADNIARKTICGSPLYLPPEMVKGSSHDKTADIWCIGVLLFELITGSPPFPGNDLETVARNIIKLNISWPAQMDPDAKDLISKILKLNGKDRLPLEQILTHKFFSKFFPNAIKELIKPENQENKTFVVSLDIPDSCGTTPKKNITKSPFEIAKPTPLEDNKNINNNTNNNINIKNNLGVNNFKKISKINNKPKKKVIKTKTMIAPKVNIDISTKNDKLSKNIIKKMNNNKVSITTNYNSNNKRINHPTSNSYNKTNYDLKFKANNEFRNSYKTKIIDTATNISPYHNNSNNYRNSYKHSNNNISNYENKYKPNKEDLSTKYYSNKNVTYFVSSNFLKPNNDQNTKIYTTIQSGKNYNGHNYRRSYISNNNNAIYYSNNNNNK